MSEIGDDEPRDLPEETTLGEFMDGLPPAGVPTQFYAAGQWWNAVRMDDVPMPREGRDE